MGCGDNIAGVDSSERYAVDLEGAGNQEDTLGKVLQEDDALSAETSSEEDEDSTGSEAGPRGGGSDGFANLEDAVSYDFSKSKSKAQEGAHPRRPGGGGVVRPTPQSTSSNWIQQTLVYEKDANSPSWAGTHPPQGTTSGPSGCDGGPLSSTSRMPSSARQVSWLLELPTS